MKVPFSLAEITEDDLRAVREAMLTRVVALGPHVTAFEAMVARHYKKSYAVALSSGTAGLQLALIASGARQATVPTYTFIATMNAAVLAVGQRNVTLCDEVATAEASVPCHLFGEPSVHAVRDDAIVDACESIGDVSLPLGRAAVFSFWANKQIVTGEGGMVVTDDEQLAATVRALANHGRYANGDGQCALPGFNYRMNEMSAALGMSQFKRIGETLAKRQRAAGWYFERLGDLKYADGSAFTGMPASRKSWFVYNIQVPGNARDYLWRKLAAEGVACKRYFERPVHKHEAYAKLGGAFPVADWLAARGLTLPLFNEITEAQVTYVCKALGVALKECLPEHRPWPGH